MRLSEGIEWGIHICSILSPLPEGASLSAKHLAEFFDLPAPYLAKILQQLSSAGILRTKRGKQGGNALSRPADQMSILQIVEAIEGKAAFFHCSEIRQRGPCAGSRGDYKKPCSIAAAMWRADHAWRAELAKTLLSEVAQEGWEQNSHAQQKKAATWVSEKMR